MTAHSTARVATIDESRCIGCARCIDACPIDAIVGAAKWMHSVVPDLCSGCGECAPPCPVDCIDFVLRPGAAWSARDESAARAREAARRSRRLVAERERAVNASSRRRRSVIATALERRRARAATKGTAR